MANKLALYGARPSARAQLVKWTGLANGDIGIGSVSVASTPGVNLPSYPDRTIQITGTLGAGGSIQVEGSNDSGTTWNILTDPLGNNLVFTALGMKQITECPDLLRVKVTAGDGTTSLNAYLSMRGNLGAA